MKAELTLQELLESTPDILPTSIEKYQDLDVREVKELRLSGMKSLTYNSLVGSHSSEYNPYITFYGVSADETPSLKDHKCRVRCNCAAFRVFLMYALKRNNALGGGRTKKYKRVEGSTRPPVNPKDIVGLCKHLVALARTIF